ncbi:UNVERIFIED_ORG: hypothetical protein FHR68_002490 [Xanthomonas campestris]
MGDLALPVAVAETDRQIQPFASQIDPVVVGGKAQFDLRMRRMKGVHARQQPAGGKGADHADAEHLAITPIGKALQGGRDAVEGLAEHRR